MITKKQLEREVNQQILETIKKTLILWHSINFYNHFTIIILYLVLSFFINTKFYFYNNYNTLKSRFLCDCYSC